MRSHRPGREDVAQVGQDAQAVLAVIHHENHAIRTVMGRGNCFHRHLAEWTVSPDGSTEGR